MQLSHIKEGREGSFWGRQPVLRGAKQVLAMKIPIIPLWPSLSLDFLAPGDNSTSQEVNFNLLSWLTSLLSFPIPFPFLSPFFSPSHLPALCLDVLGHCGVQHREDGDSSAGIMLFELSSAILL